MSVSPYLDVYSVTIANISQNSISVPINIGSSKQTVETLIDSGAGGLFIDQNFTKNFDINYLDEPVKAYNVDGTENKQGTINAYVLDFRTLRLNVQQSVLECCCLRRFARMQRKYFVYQVYDYKV
jgi:hypothetical protein